MATLSSEKIKSLFGDLGKPTLRGIRKCPKCGTYNGTRGISCKNKSCDAIFKENGERKKQVSVEAVKIITGSTAQVYSVRLRDRGPDYRGFVQLPLLDALDVTTEQSLEPTLLTQSTARCFVDTCQKIESRIKNSLELTTNPCHHIKSAMNCITVAQSLTLKNSVLNALPISAEMRQDIWLLATETTGPLVQRVSKNIMVVKCTPVPRHPLGFLHLSFFEVSKNKDIPEHKYHCSCKSNRNHKNLTSVKEDGVKHCIHFYACIGAFASDDKLSEEFAFYISVELAPAPERHFVAILSDSQQQQLCEVEVEVLPDTASLIAATSGQAEDDDDLLDNIPPSKKEKKDENTLPTGTSNSSVILTLQDSTAPTVKVKPVKKVSGTTPVRKIAIVPIEESTASINFHSWLASVTERINQTMHYQFDGHPDPLVFHVPQVFFDCLQQRISAGGKKKRLPNCTTVFIRKDALPLGTFSKYTWHITSIHHVKQIFDTPEMPLLLTKTFVENRDGTYDLYEPQKGEVQQLADLFRKTENSPLIKPFELKTFIKVGSDHLGLLGQKTLQDSLTRNFPDDQKEQTPFIIEWIPDILPSCHIGELRIKFEYGHLRNGQMEHKVSQQVIQIQPLPM